MDYPTAINTLAYYSKSASNRDGSGITLNPTVNPIKKFLSQFMSAGFPVSDKEKSLTTLTPRASNIDLLPSTI
jgi:hypothetical protein